MQVIKRDGSLEEFSQEKLLRIAKAAGLDDTQATQLVKNVGDWAQTHDHQKLSTLAIRDKVIEELKKVNQRAADFFIWYQDGKTKNGQV
ncbi:hypothetical protein A2630_03850 [Candidatus Woesebacteria bacterium RIFCSPHIGHO2_01_FULL_44_10]|uniref:ATP-cone domain-containing protein n=1 Tax=Candidatus Woesebacteria bacterium RIFCSPLOWO2_01_FULL_44_14 TaxID=1802525 RepID=A0A1F8C3M0_9BACT|nr:MAG: hypothetical protein A2630_03850 [Candidatus Woesebacteria bacterium RIFCSPHIGHO2_01_FULL_44_10]OGM55613.1 MAG: hypothetical protein A3F62_02270 [Candidatus Woesebacteria bacterium RIFCSPHIGHO2_12_FULL_44_11]OGM70886.1 MAG: hypothetical protein A2975_01260 [Candidatus Woesebacteria bacterium RIFCSPLOWO2_01_FULL_44_14]